MAFDMRKANAPHPLQVQSRAAVRRGLFSLCAACLLSAGADAAELLRHPYQDLEAVTLSTSSALPWLGETLEYDISWSGITVGRAWLGVDKVVNIGGKAAYHIISKSRSTPFIENFYHVDDINEAWIDTETIKSFGYYKKIQEGGHFHNEWALFDMAAKMFKGEKMNKKREVSTFEGVLDSEVNDVLSSVYAVRLMELKADASLEIKVNTKRNWTLTVKVLRAEKAKTGYGKRRCYVIEPRVGEEGIFVPKKGKRMFVWLTDDNLRLPLILKAEISIGSVTAKLKKRTME